MERAEAAEVSAQAEQSMSARLIRGCPVSRLKTAHSTLTSPLVAKAAISPVVVAVACPAMVVMAAAAAAVVGAPEEMVDLRLQVLVKVAEVVVAPSSMVETGLLSQEEVADTSAVARAVAKI